MRPLPLVLAITLASASAFAPSSPITTIDSISTSQTALRAALPADPAAAVTTSRRRLFQTSANAFLSAAIALSTTTATLANPSVANAADELSLRYTAIENSTNALSNSLGHAVVVIDGLNAQASRLGSSPHPAHPIAVLDGMHAQARRLTRDISTSRNVLDVIQSQAREITIADENFQLASQKVSHAASVLDGILAQSVRLEGASSWGGGEVAAASNSASSSTDDQIIYMLSILDGLNAQVKRLNLDETLGALDEINARAARALL